MLWPNSSCVMAIKSMNETQKGFGSFHVAIRRRRSPEHIAVFVRVDPTHPLAGTSEATGIVPDKRLGGQDSGRVRIVAKPYMTPIFEFCPVSR